MNKAQLVEAITDQVGGRQQAEEAVDAVLDTIVRTVVGGERVSVTGFGAFEKVARPARYARNPQTGERVRVKKTAVPRFRPGQGFKDLTGGVKKLPRTGTAIAKAPAGTLTPLSSTSTAAKKTAAKKTTAKKTTAKKTTAKKTTAKKTTATPAAKRTTATAKKTAGRATSPAKSAAKKTTTARTPAKKTTAAKSTAAKKTTAKKAPARKVTAKKAPAKRATRRG